MCVKVWYMFYIFFFWILDCDPVLLTNLWYTHEWTCLFFPQNLVEKNLFKNIIANNTNTMNSDFKDNYSTTQVLCPNNTVLNSMSNGSGAVLPKMSPVKKEEVLETPKHVLYDPSKIKLGWRNPPQKRAGMSNLGNTCYLNSTLQVSCFGVWNIMKVIKIFQSN